MCVPVTSSRTFGTWILTQTLFLPAFLPISFPFRSSVSGCPLSSLCSHSPGFLLFPSYWASRLSSSEGREARGSGSAPRRRRREAGGTGARCRRESAGRAGAGARAGLAAWPGGRTRERRAWAWPASSLARPRRPGPQCSPPPPARLTYGL